MKKASVSGKGGTGKSLTVTLLARALSEAGHTVLIVDSDESNVSLYRMLGFDREPKPIIDLFGGERKVANVINQGNSPTESEPLLRSLAGQEIYLKDISGEYLLDKDNVKLLTVGKITTAFEGCACPLGQVCRMFLEKLVLLDNEIALVDMEAGVEHFGRGIEKAIDTAFIVVEPSFESIALASKINFMARATGIERVWAIINKISSQSIEERLRGELTKRGIKTIGAIHYDIQISEDCLMGNPLGDCEANEDMRRIVHSLLQELR
ncbi:P-loop NTPase [Chloroflexota bacterium]